DDETYVLQSTNESVLPRVVTEGDMEWTVFKTRSSRVRMIRGTPVRMISELHIFTVSYKGEVIMEGIFNREPMRRERLTQFMFFKRPNEEDPKAHTIIPFLLKNIYNYMGRGQIESIETNPGSLYAERNGMQYRYMLQSKIFNFFARQGFSPVINHAAIDDYEGANKMTYLKALDVAQNAEPIASMSLDDANKVLSVHPMEFYFLPSGADENSIRLNLKGPDKSGGARLSSEETDGLELYRSMKKEGRNRPIQQTDITESEESLSETFRSGGWTRDIFYNRIRIGESAEVMERWFKADRRSYEDPPEIDPKNLLLPSELRRRNGYVRIGNLKFIDSEIYKNLPENTLRSYGTTLIPVTGFSETEFSSDTPIFFASVSLIAALLRLPLGSARLIDAGSGHGLTAITALEMGVKQVVLIEKDAKMLQMSVNRLTSLGYESGIDFVAVEGDLTAPETFIHQIPDDGTETYLASNIGYWENKSYTADNTHSLKLARLLRQRPNTYLLGYLSGGHRGSYTGNDSDEIRYGGIHARFESQEIPQIGEAGFSAEPESVTRFNVSELKEVFLTYLFTSATPDAERISKTETADGARLAATTAVPRLSNLVLAVNIVDLGVEITDGDQVIYRESFKKLSDLIDLIREMEIGKVYIYGGLYEMSPLSVYLHQQIDIDRHFVHFGKSTVMAGNGYHTRKETVGGIELKDAFGNAFSILSLLKLNPKLAGTDIEQEFEELIRLLTDKNIRVMTDFIAWLSPDSVDESNYRRTMYYEIPEEQNEVFRNLKTESEKQQWIDNLVAEDGSWFAVRLKENGEERVIRVSHFRFFGSHSGDQAMPDPFHPDTQSYYVEALKKMIDHGVREFRVDLGHEVLKDHAGHYFELMRQKGVNLDEWIHYSGVDAQPGESFESWFSRQPEPWERIISEARIYAIESCNCDISFSMETYDPADRHQLYLQGVNASYETNLFEAFQNISRGGASAHVLDEAISILIGSRPHAFGYITNFDQISLKMLEGPWRGAAMLTVLLSHFGVAMMVGKRDFMMRKGEVAKIVGSTYDESDPHHHPFASEDELDLYRNFGLLQEKFADAPWKHLIDIFNANVATHRSFNERILNNSDRDRYQTLMWQDENGDFRIILIDFWPLTPKETVRIEIPGQGEIKGFDPAAIEVTDSSTGKRYSTGVWDGTKVPVINLEFNESEQNLDFRFLTIKARKPEKAPVKTRGSPSKSRLLIESAQMLGHEYPSRRLSALRKILSDSRFESVRNEALLLAAADENPAVRALAANFTGHFSNQYKLDLELDELLNHLQNPLQSYSTFRADSDLIKITRGNERQRSHNKRSALIRGISQLVAPVSANHSDSPERRKIIDQIRDQLISESEQDFENNEIRLQELS
ncbi:MAG: hypothetical protein KC649_02380, partial [Candidatus Omnitrophica bacterium]|nr:hypothetical protein [Candidatus Omnitrophota bacterium]